MRKNWRILLLTMLVAVAVWSFRPKSFDNSDKDKLLIELISYVLDRGHFDPKDMDDNFSENVFMDYLERLDPQKRYFLQSDIDEFSKYKYLIDDQIKSTDVSFFNLTYERYIQRVEEIREVYPSLLDKPFDFSKDETINVDYENKPYATSKADLVERWEKQLKFSSLNNYIDNIKEEEQKKQDDPSYKMISFEELEEQARESSVKTMKNLYSTYEDSRRKDWFSIYLNAIVEEFDPHTFYFAPEDKDRFDVSMSGKFEGIGARLQKRNGEIKVIEVIPGGPAWRDKKIEVGDEIVKVAQGEEEAVDIVGMRLDDAVKLIKGPKGTEVRLTIKKVGGTVEIIPVIRDLVELEEAFAKSSLVKKGNRSFGLISLPKFYADFRNYDKRNAANDIEEEIKRLKEQEVEGLVIDLRDNGGGSLRTVVDMAGLFIEKGPVVQVKSIGEKKEVLEDTDSSILWDGPLVILVNELSASASEILAAAMQDYKRAIIIGSKQTYGKGTVQNVIDLNRFISNNSHGDVGALKITTQKFYRVNGNSTQLEGVKSDVVVPDQYSYIEIGERDLSNPLPYDKISAAEFNIWQGYLDYDQALENSKNRIRDNEQMTLIEENAKWVKERYDHTTYSLNYEKLRKEQGENETYSQKFEALDDYRSNLTFAFLPHDAKLIEQDSVLKGRRASWLENLEKDVYIEEAISVLEDLQLNYLKKINKVAKLKD